MQTPSTEEAEGVLESLRLGIPPRSFGRHFTVGRDLELDVVEKILDSESAHAHLIQGNYGEGKSHLLETIKEIALLRGYAVASVTIDARNGIRFNRMDQIITAIARNITYLGAGDNGIGCMFEKFISSNDKAAANRLKSYALRMGVSNWARTSAESPLRNIVRDAFYNSKRTGYINWQDHNYSESWRVLSDLNNLALLSGLRGIAIFFDEFEDVIQNLNNRTWQEKAFENFFSFTNPDKHVGKVFFGVTPEFTTKTLYLMRSKYFGNLNETKGQLENIPKFRLKGLTLQDFQTLGDRVCEFHSMAYAWDAIRFARENGLDKQVELAFSARGLNSTRLIIQQMVEWLDAMYEAQG